MLLHKVKTEIVDGETLVKVCAPSEFATHGQPKAAHVIQNVCADDPPQNTLSSRFFCYQ